MNCLNGIPDGVFGTAANVTDLGTTESIQRVKKKSLALNFRAAFQ
ncbi:hypothetical protein SCIP_0607 [Scardovia inopinata JCM 12537]|nr:hypothetical protein SCIP_0607 [Scardovia inopinata JCM 12537]